MYIVMSFFFLFSNMTERAAGPLTENEHEAQVIK